MQNETGMATTTGNPFVDMANRIVATNGSVESMREVLAMEREYRKDQAEAAYNVDMVKVRQELTGVSATKLNPSTGSKYPPLADILDIVTPILTKYGFFESFTEDEPNLFVLTIAHRMGASRTFKLRMDDDNVGMKGGNTKTAVQGKASTVSYARRYLEYMAHNLKVNNDVDGAKVDLTDYPVTLETLTLLVKKHKLKESALCDHYEVAALKDLDNDQLENAIRNIVATRETKKK